MINWKEAEKLDQGKLYVDYDTHTECWGVFGDLSEFCYVLVGDRETAEEWLKKNSQ